MSLTGKATAKVLRGRINRLDTLCISAYDYAVAGGYDGTEEEFMKAASSVVEATEAAQAVTEDMRGYLDTANETLEIIREIVDDGEDGPPIVCEASGEVISVSDSSNRLLKGLTIYGKTTQNGTPSPDAPVPLVSAGDGGSIGVNVAGKNLVSPDAVASYYNYQYLNVYEQEGLLLPAGAYTFSVGETPTGLYVYDFESGSLLNKTINSKALTFTIAEAKRLHFSAYKAEHFDATTVNTLQLEVGNTATVYEPYTVQQISLATPNGLPGIPVASGGNYTDSNGQQWVCDEIDLARGVYVQRIYNPNLSTLAWFEGKANHDGDGKIYSVMLSGVIQNTLGCMISHFKKSNLPTTAVWEQLAMGEFLLTDHLAVCATPYATLNEFISYLESEKAEAVFALKEPIETALDADTLAAYAALHTNKPNTTFMNDANAYMAVGYVADTKLYIDNKFTELQNAILATGANV